MHPASGNVLEIMIKMVYDEVDALHQPASHTIFSYWVS